jgi:RNA ligase
MIRTLDDALALIEGRKDFVVKRAPDYIAIDYAVAFPDTFDDPLRTELRGLKFYPDTGEVMARPLHKFFNVGEKAHTQPHLLDFDADHIIMDKLDGSMIHPALLRDGTLRFMTRAGVTDVSKKAERHLTPALRDRLTNLLAAGFTPTFEFTAPDNRIVVRYPSSGLTLLAVRATATGEYESRAGVEGWADALGLPVVRTWDRPASTSALIETVRALKGAEGVVICFASGLWVKIKGEEYALMHKAKDSITREKNVLATILDGLADDLRPLLAPEDRAQLDAYEKRLTATMLAEAERVDALTKSGAHLDQKAFAVEHLDGCAPWFRSMAFSVRAGKASALEAVRQSLRKHCGTQGDVDAARARIGTTWDELAGAE